MKKNTIKTIVALCLCALFCVSALAACTAPQGPASEGSKATAEPKETETITEAPATEEPATEEPAAPTADPFENAAVLYGGSSSISLPYEPDVGETKLNGAFTDEILDRAAEDGSVFAVRIGVGHIDCETALLNRINELTTDGPILERYIKRGIWESEFTELYGAVDYLWLIDRYYPDGFELLFNDYWEKQATEEEQNAYNAATAERDELYRQAYGAATQAEAERLKALGLAVEYDGSWHITGLLTADQIRDFPAGEEHSFYIDWQLDPELTAEKIIAAEGLNTPD